MDAIHPDLWLAAFPRPAPRGHKYARGHAVIVGARAMTGATRLAAEACARIGAGLVSVIAPAGTGAIYRASLPPHIIVEDMEPDAGSAIHHHFSDPRRTALLIGPGGESGQPFGPIIRRAAERQPPIATVMDAGALAAFGGGAAQIETLSRFPAVLTPHEGEFEAMFGASSSAGDKVARTCRAARETGAVIVHKGAQTVIADANRVAVLAPDAPYLATAGTGDVLAGMITGLLAQGMEPYLAACAAAWIHARAGKTAGAGLVAADLPGLIPPVLHDLGL